MHSHNMDQRTYISLDLETTGLSPDSDDIIEVAAVKFQGEEVVDVFHSLVNPHRPLPYRIQLLCGIRPAELEGAPDLAAIAAKLTEFLAYHPVVGHNVGFDLGFLQRKGLTLSNLAYDTYELATVLLSDALDHSLSGVADWLGLPARNSHRALADAQTAREVFLALMDRATHLEPDLLVDLARLTARPGWGMGHLFHDIAQAVRPGAATGRAADSTALTRELGAILAASRNGRQPLKAAAQGKSLDVKGLSALLGPGGPLARTLPGYEHRPEQAQMMEAVAGALEEGHHLVVEAGTGTGKSLAYLLPSACFALRKGLPVVISTNTIGLQEQLIGKDIPTLRAALADDSPTLAGAEELRAVQLKGRANYLCLYRWAGLACSDGLSLDEMRLLARLRVWMGSTQHGDRAELNLNAGDIALWPRLSAQGDDCPGERCLYQREGLCFLYRARRAAESAHLVVVNHSLLLSDLVGGTGILPEYRHLVVDEAHHLEGEATRQLGYQASLWDLMEHLDAASRPSGQRGSDVVTLVRELFLDAAPSGRRGKLEQQVQGVARQVDRCRSQASAFFGLVRDFFEQQSGDRGEYDRHLRLTAAKRAQPGWAEVEVAWENLGLCLSDVASALEGLYIGLEDLAGPEDPDRQGVLLEIASLLHRSEEFRHRLGSLVCQPEQDTVYWLSWSGRSGALSLCAAPLNVAPFLSSALFGPRDSVILTGATLSTEGTFQYLKSRVGLDGAEELIVESPFDYPNAALIYVAGDLPEPGRPDYQAGLQQALLQLCRATGGRTLVLFTSHAALRASHAALRGPLEEHNILVLGQGIDGSPRQLLRLFREHPRTVVLGTASFWEGVDVVGDTLSVVAIARLPFNVPTEPIFAARAETFEDRFNEYALPQAALRFKQGFGRLIRSKSDRGALVVLDSRLDTKGYRHVFLDSLPRCTVVPGSVRDLARTVKGWLEG